MPRREDHEVRDGHVGHWIKKKKEKPYKKTEIRKPQAECLIIVDFKLSSFCECCIVSFG